MSIVQMDFNLEKEVVKYDLYNVFPTEIGAITLGSEEVGAIGEYTVTFAYSHYDVSQVNSNFTAEDITEALANIVQDTINDTIAGAKSLLEDALNPRIPSTDNTITRLSKTGSSWTEYLLGDK